LCSNTTFATVSSGKVIAKKIATVEKVTITAISAENPAVLATHEITVRPVVTSVSIAAPQKCIDFPGADRTLQLAASCVPGNALQEVDWKSGNTRIATVDATGKVTALKLGTVIIAATAKDGSGKSAKVTLAVVNAVKGIEITGATILASGKSAQLKLSFTPANATNKAVKWFSSNAALATVSGSGKVTAKKIATVDTVTITATSAENPAVTATHVMTLRPLVTSVSIAAPQKYIDFLGADKTLQLTASCLPGNALQEVDWKSSNTKIATVDATGRVTALKLGTVTITATARDGSGKSAKVIITVRNGPPH
jgi:uncharacterized protein YjdB